MYEKFNAGPAKDVTLLLRDPKAVLAVTDLMSETLAFLEKGKGKYGTDGTFDSKKLTLGSAVHDPAPAHRLIRNHLLVTAAYSQGLAYIFDHMNDRELVSELNGSGSVFEEANINRSLTLMNFHYKANENNRNSQLTLSELTSLARANNSRARKRMREDIAPIFVAHGLWAMEKIDDEKRNFSAGPLLIMFSDLVLGRMKPFDGEAA